jgi:diguanylate cyclase (GGDEF)-like protein
MKPLQRIILEQLVAGSAEPVLVARIDRPDWPVVLLNPAFESIASSDSAGGRPFADVVEELIGRELAMEVSESVRVAQEITIPVELRGREYLLALKPLTLDNDSGTRYVATYWRGMAGTSVSAADHEAQQALFKAKRRIRNLSRDDQVTGLLNSKAFKDVLEHDWAVASREKSRLALVSFSLQDFDQYLAVFGQHASDSCQRRVAQAIRRCLRRASDVAARVNGPNGERLVVLSHASAEEGVTEFAGRIAAAVRELRLHHPRSSVEKFVTVDFNVAVRQAGEDNSTATDFLNEILSH